MTRDEFALWGKHHQALFPDFSAWWERLKVENRESATAISGQWFQILSKVSLADAKQASNQMLSGEVELCPAYERSMLASRIAAAAGELRSSRERFMDNQRYDRERRATPTGTSAGALYAQILERIDAGEDARSAAEAVIPKVEPDKSGPRFRCYKCQDTGIVTVWHMISMRAALAGTIDQRTNRRTMAAPCECSAADAICLPDERTAPKGWHGWRDSARYTPDRYCRCPHGDVHNPERIAELLEWVADYQTHQTKSHPNYSPELAAFNGG